MNNKFIFTILLLCISCLAFCQAKKPTIMVVPSDGYCDRNGYIMQFDNMGTTITVPDYEKAFLKDENIKVMISQIAEFMANNEFPIQSLEAELKRIKNETAEMSMMGGKYEGGEIAESPIEKLRRAAKADIIINLDYKINKLGPKQQVEFNLQAIDAYSSKIISGVSGLSSTKSTSESSVSIFEESGENLKDIFLGDLDKYFRDLFNNGREISVTLLRYDTCPIDFEEEFEIDNDYVELADLIDDWFSLNTVEGRYSRESKSANRMRYNQVRIPIYSTNPRTGKEVAIDAEDFIKGLVRMLKKEPYNLIVGSTPKGLGEVWITIGDK